MKSTILRQNQMTICIALVVGVAFPCNIGFAQAAETGTPDALIDRLVDKLSRETRASLEELKDLERQISALSAVEQRALANDYVQAGNRKPQNAESLARYMGQMIKVFPRSIAIPEMLNKLDLCDSAQPLINIVGDLRSFYGMSPQDSEITADAVVEAGRRCLAASNYEKGTHYTVLSAALEHAFVSCGDAALSRIEDLDWNPLDKYRTLARINTPTSVDMLFDRYENATHPELATLALRALAMCYQNGSLETPQRKQRVFDEIEEILSAEGGHGKYDAILAAGGTLDSRMIPILEQVTGDWALMARNIIKGIEDHLEAQRPKTDREILVLEIQKLEEGIAKREQYQLTERSESRRARREVALELGRKELVDRKGKLAETDAAVGTSPPARP